MVTNNTTRLNAAASVVREEDLDDMQNLHREITARIDDAAKDGRAYMMAQYVRILAMISSETKRIRDRFDRESLASHRKAHKEMKAAHSNDTSSIRDDS